MDKVRITDINLSLYMKQTYNITEEAQDSYTIGGITPFLQRDYGEDSDCTLMSICTALYARGASEDIQEIYNVVEKIARKYFYRGNYGTNALFNRRIYKESCDKLGINYNPSIRFIKKWFFNEDMICSILDSNKPIVLSMYSDGRNYYNKHTVLAIGYKYWSDGTVMIQVYDNWTKTMCYVDYQKIGFVSSITW